MAPTVIRIPSDALGRNRALAHDFALGTLPGGGYGIVWRRGPAFLAETIYTLRWEPPHDPVRIEFEGHEFLFCLDTATDAELAKAPRAKYEHQFEGR